MRHHTLNYGQIIGLCTEDAGNISSSWDNVNLADGTNSKVQETVRRFIDYHSDLIGKPNLSGLVEPNASLANERALEIARDKTGKSKVLCTNLSHSSIPQACKRLSLEPIVLDAVPDLIKVSEVNNLKFKIIVEGSNIPMNEEVEDLVHKKKILVVPDIVANAGGVISSYVEYIGGTPREMFKMVEQKIKKNTSLVLSESKKQRKKPRDVALDIAKRRVCAKCKICIVEN